MNIPRFGDKLAGMNMVGRKILVGSVGEIDCHESPSQRFCEKVCKVENGIVRIPKYLTFLVGIASPQFKTGDVAKISVDQSIYGTIGSVTAVVDRRFPNEVYHTGLFHGYPLMVHQFGFQDLSLLVPSHWETVSLLYYDDWNLMDAMMRCDRQLHYPDGFIHQPNKWYG